MPVMNRAAMTKPVIATVLKVVLSSFEVLLSMVDSFHKSGTVKNVCNQSVKRTAHILSVVATT